MYRYRMCFYILLISHFLLTTACTGHDEIKKDMRDSVRKEGDKLKQELQAGFVSMFRDLSSDLISKEGDKLKKELQAGFVSMFRDLSSNLISNEREKFKKELKGEKEELISMLQEELPATLDQYIASKFAFMNAAVPNTMNPADLLRLYPLLVALQSQLRPHIASNQVAQDVSDSMEPVPNLTFQNDQEKSN